MKKTLALIMALVLCFGLVACGTPAEEDTGKPKKTTTTTEDVVNDTPNKEGQQADNTTTTTQDGTAYFVTTGLNIRSQASANSEALGVYADWMKYNSRSIYGCTMAEPEFTAPRGTRLTQSVDGKRLYIHLVEYPYEFLEFRGLADKIDYAQFLHDGSEVFYTIGSIDHFSEARTQSADLVAFKIPIVKPNTVVPVIEVFLK